jgi:hypothetical protein
MSSIVWSLRRLVDATFKADDAERKRNLETVPADPDAEGGARLPPVERAAAAAPARFRCRVCELEQGDGSYCPACLADTMERAAG